jgi:hypothetical protein
MILSFSIYIPFFFKVCHPGRTPGLDTGGRAGTQQLRAFRCRVPDKLLFSFPGRPYLI